MNPYNFPKNIHILLYSNLLPAKIHNKAHYYEKNLHPKNFLDKNFEQNNLNPHNDARQNKDKNFLYKQFDSCIHCFPQNPDITHA